MQASVDDIVHRAKRRRLLDRPVNIKLGMVSDLVAFSRRIRQIKCVQFFASLFIVNFIQSGKSISESYFIVDETSFLGGGYVTSDGRSRPETHKTRFIFEGKVRVLVRPICCSNFF